MKILLALVSILLSFLNYVFCQTYQPQRGVSFAATNYASNFLAVYDFNGDGLDDLLVGGSNGVDLNRTPIYLLISQGNGSFVEQTSVYINGTLVAANPESINADYNGDSTMDFAIFDKGNLERGQDPVHTGFYGEDAQILLSNGNGSWDISGVLAETHQAANHFGKSELHIKFGATSDINNDGYADIYVEAGGGSQQLDSHIYNNNGDGTFTIGQLGEQIWIYPFKGPNLLWRQQACTFADVNNDGYADLLVGQLRRTNNGQENLTSFVLLNNGNGQFPENLAIALPHPDWHDGYTYVRSILPIDLNQDGWLDMIYCQQRGQDEGNAEDDAFSGNYMQAYINNGGTGFTDETMEYLNLTADILATTSDVYGLNNNSGVAKLIDMNEDGFKDIFITKGPPVDKNNPLIYFNDGSNYFSPASPEVYSSITNGQQWFGESSYPIDLNNDGLVDFVSADLLAGADGEYGTGDEYDEIFPIMGVRNYPKVSGISISTNQSLADGLELTFVPELGITHFYFEKIHGGSLYTASQQLIPAGAFLERSVAEGGFLFTPNEGFEGNAYFYIQGASSASITGLTGSKFIAKVEVGCVGLRPLIGIEASATSLCKGELVTLSGLGGNSYTWTPNINNGVPFEPTETTTYEVTGFVGNCSSTTSVTVEVKDVPEKPVITQIDDPVVKLSSSSLTGNQWFLNGNAIAGAIEAEYYPTEVGSYTVQINLSDCLSPLSDPVEVVNILLSSGQLKSQQLPWPNPVSQTLSLPESPKNYSGYRIYDLDGKVALSGEPTSEIDVSSLTRGMYLIELLGPSDIEIFRFIKE